MGAIAPKILDVDVGCVRLGREAIIADVDTSICDSQAINVEGVEAVSVLGEGLARFSILVNTQDGESLQKHCC